MILGEQYTPPKRKRVRRRERHDNGALVVIGMPEEEYHADEALSSTGAKKLLRSPAAYDYWRNNPEKTTDEFDLGSAVHAAVLGVGPQIEVYPDYVLASNGAISTNAAKEFAEAVRKRGNIPVKAAVAEKVNKIRDAVLEHETAGAFLSQIGDAEVSVFRYDDEVGVDLRCRFDYLPRPTKRRPRVALDLKTTTDASPWAFAAACARYGYHVSRAHYLHTYNDPDLEMVFIAVEVEPPYHVAVYRLDEDFTEIGVKRAAKARARLAKHLADGQWPGLPPGVTLLPPPMFEIYDSLDSENDPA